MHEEECVLMGVEGEDKERVKRALQNKRDDNYNDYSASSSTSLMEYDIDQPPSRMKIAFAAGTSAATVALLALHTPLPVSACAFVVVAAYAAVDPLDDGGGLRPAVLVKTDVLTRTAGRDRRA